MTAKLLGAMMILLGCGGYGCYMAACHIRQTRMLEDLCGVLRVILWELQYKQTPLPELCRLAASEAKSSLRGVFEDLASELDRQVAPNVSKCMLAALADHRALPPVVQGLLRELGTSMGRFDLKGQLEALEAVSASCGTSLETLRSGQDVRLRTYRTLGICCGAAIVILFI